MRGVASFSSNNFPPLFTEMVANLTVIKKEIKVETDVIIQNEVRDGRPVSVVYMIDTLPKSKNSTELRNILLEPRLPLVDLNIPKQATINSSSGQIEDQDIFICFTCGVKLRTIKKLHKHQEIHNKPTYVTIKPSCHLTELCIENRAIERGSVRNERILKTTDTSDVSTSLTNDLKLTKVRDATTRQFQCAVCMKDFRRQSHLTRHEKIHLSERLYSCDVCEKTFKVMEYLTQHKRAHHEEKKHKCQYCTKCFDNNQKVIRHERCHTNERPFNCEVCGKRFKSKTNLNSHQPSHLEEKSYKCQYCLKEFAYKHLATRHESTHADENIFQCDKCYKTFKRESYWKEHVHTHTGEKPYKCHLCGKGFAFSSSLTRHKSVHKKAQQ